MHIEPSLPHHVEGQRAMFNRSVVPFADKADRDLFRPGADDRKTDRVPVTLLGEMRTGGGITKVAEFPQVSVGSGQFPARGATVTRPSRS